MIEGFLIKAIRLYQQTLSFDHGWFKVFYPAGYCKYIPSCSEYCIGSIKEYGAAKGSVLGIWRVLRCNPWSKGGFDPVPGIKQ